MTEPRERISEQHFADYLLVLRKTIQALKLKERAPELASDASLRSSLIVEPRRNTRLVLIKVEQSDPALAAEISNAIAAAYVQYNLELKMKGASEAISWLTE